MTLRISWVLLKECLDKSFFPLYKVGLVVCLFGHRIFKPLLALLGFSVGSFAAYATAEVALRPRCLQISLQSNPFSLCPFGWSHLRPFFLRLWQRLRAPREPPALRVVLRGGARGRSHLCRAVYVRKVHLLDDGGARLSTRTRA